MKWSPSIISSPDSYLFCTQLVSHRNECTHGYTDELHSSCIRTNEECCAVGRDAVADTGGATPSFSSSRPSAPRRTWCVPLSRTGCPPPAVPAQMWARQVPAQMWADPVPGSPRSFAGDACGPCSMRRTTLHHAACSERLCVMQRAANRMRQRRARWMPHGTRRTPHSQRGIHSRAASRAAACDPQRGSGPGPRPRSSNPSAPPARRRSIQRQAAGPSGAPRCVAPRIRRSPRRRAGEGRAFPPSPRHQRPRRRRLHRPTTTTGRSCYKKSVPAACDAPCADVRRSAVHWIVRGAASGAKEPGSTPRRSRDT